MIIQKFTDAEPGQQNKEWLNARLGKFTGTRPIKKIVVLKDAIVEALESQKVEFKKTAKKEELEKLLTLESLRKIRDRVFLEREKDITFYELIAEKLMVSEEDTDGYVPDETPMARGTRLEKFAIDRFEKETGKKVNSDKVLWMRDDQEDIAVSPDATVVDTNDEEAVESKCKSSALHVKAYLTKQVPDEHLPQVMQYFIVNDNLQKLNMVFYDPRLPAINYFVIEVTRESIGEDTIAEYLEYQHKTLAEVNEVVSSITF